MPDVLYYMAKLTYILSHPELSRQDTYNTALRRGVISPANGRGISESMHQKDRNRLWLGVGGLLMARNMKKNESESMPTASKECEPQMKATEFYPQHEGFEKNDCSSLQIKSLSQATQFPILVCEYCLN